MNIIIAGYGRMGREVEEVCARRNHNITLRVDPKPGVGDQDTLTASVLEGADAVIEFSLADGVVENASMYAEAGVPAVVGTTGWDKRRNEVETIVTNRGGSFLWGSNFSIGAHVLFALAEHASKIMNKLPDYDVMALEIHHAKKKDSPSGTAMRLGEKIISGLERKTKIVTEKLDRQIEPDELHVASVRGGTIPGIHTMLMDSAADTIEIKHTARTRSGFALGAVLAAEWLVGKRGFYRVEDFVNDFLFEGDRQ